MVDIKNLVNQAKQTENQSEAKTHADFEYVPPAEGKFPARLIEYIELGKQPQSHEGQAKPDAEEVRVTFELLGAKNIREVEVEGGKKEFADRISITMPKKQSDKAKFYKLFKAMTYGRDSITHMAEMLGEAFFVVVKHTKSQDGKKTYANIYGDGQWRVESPKVHDPMTETTTDYSSKIRQPLSPIKLFLWAIPTKETWDSLFIDGVREKKNADGTVTQESKNWLQELILSAKDFGGSALEQMLGGLDSLPTENKAVSTSSGETTGTEASADAADAEAGTTTPETKPEDAQDELAALGLT